MFHLVIFSIQRAGSKKSNESKAASSETDETDVTKLRDELCEKVKGNRIV